MLQDLNWPMATKPTPLVDAAIQSKNNIPSLLPYKS